MIVENLETNNEFYETEKKLDPLNRVLIRDEFLKLYFDHFGINDSLHVEKMTNYHNIARAKNDEKILFVIVKTKILGKKFVQDEEYEKSILKEQMQRIKDKKIFLMFPSESNICDDSLKFMSLAFSGFASLDPKSEMFKIDNLRQNSSPILQKCLEKLRREKQNKLAHFDELYNFVKTDEVIIREHNRISNEILGDRLKKIYNKNDKDQSYSLFYMYDGDLYEFRPHFKENIRIALNVSEATINQILHDYIVSENEKKNKFYEFQSDMTVFNQLKRNEEEVIAQNNVGEILVFAVASIIFLVNFLIVVPQSEFITLKITLSSYFEKDASGLSQIDTISNLKDLKEFFLTNILYSLYDSIENKYNYTATKTSTESLINEQINSELIKAPNMTNLMTLKSSYYILNSNFFSGLMINFKHAEEETVLDINNQTKQKRKVEFSYQKTTPIPRTESFLSFDFTDINPLYPNTYMLYLKPTFGQNQLYWLKRQLDPIFNHRLYEFSYTLLLYNSDFDILSIYSTNFQIDTYGAISHDSLFYGFQPFINVSDQFIKILILNIIFFLLYVYLSFLIIRRFSNGLMDLRKGSYTLEVSDWIDLLVMVLTMTSMIMFVNLFLFKDKIFQISITFEEDFAYWIDIGLKIINYQRITGVIY